MVRLIGRVAILLMLSVLVSGAVLAADKKAPPKKDPVSSAFALPPGLVLTPEEMAWAESVRAELEPRLRDALRRVEGASDSEGKKKAAGEVRQIRGQIQQAINTILQQRAIKAAEEQRKKAAEARKKQAEAAKKRNKNKKHHKKRKKRK